MADTPKVYVFCDANCKWEGMTKEQILTAIMQAVNEGTIGDIDTGFITTIKTINGEPLKFFYGTQAAYNDLSDEEKANLYPVITDDTTISGIEETLDGLVQGTVIPRKAETAAALTSGYTRRQIWSGNESIASGSLAKIPIKFSEREFLIFEFAVKKAWDSTEYFIYRSNPIKPIISGDNGFELKIPFPDFDSVEIVTISVKDGDGTTNNVTMYCGNVDSYKISLVAIHEEK